MIDIVYFYSCNLDSFEEKKRVLCYLENNIKNMRSCCCLYM